MATIREGHRPVLLVVDAQVGVIGEAWDSPRVIANVAQAVRRARDQGAPVLWIQHIDDELPHGSPGWQWAPELAPAAGETVMSKRFNSAFEQTALENRLAAIGATHLALAGAATNWCIRATAHAALDRGYDLTVVEDAHTTRPMQLGDGSLIEASAIISEFNNAMTWLAYPGRNNRTVKAAALDFEASQ